MPLVELTEQQKEDIIGLAKFFIDTTHGEFPEISSRATALMAYIANGE